MWKGAGIAMTTTDGQARARELMDVAEECLDLALYPEDVLTAVLSFLSALEAAHFALVSSASLSAVRSACPALLRSLPPGFYKLPEDSLGALQLRHRLESLRVDQVVTTVAESLNWPTAFLPFGAFLLSGTSDGAISVWSTRDWTRLSCVEAHVAQCWDLIAFDAETVLSCSKDGSVVSWCAASCADGSELELTKEGILAEPSASSSAYALALVEYGRTFVAGVGILRDEMPGGRPESGALVVWTRVGAEWRMHSHSAPGAIFDIAVARRSVFAACGSGRVFSWSSGTWELERAFSSPRAWLETPPFFFSVEVVAGRYLVAGNDGGVLCGWDLDDCTEETNKPCMQGSTETIVARELGFPGLDVIITDLCFFGDCLYIAANEDLIAMDVCTLRKLLSDEVVVDFKMLSPIDDYRTLAAGHSDMVQVMMPCGDKLLTGSEDCTFKVWSEFLLN